MVVSAAVPHAALERAAAAGGIATGETGMAAAAREGKEEGIRQVVPCRRSSEKNP
jgi:hypothetical protein